MALFYRKKLSKIIISGLQKNREQPYLRQAENINKGQLNICHLSACDFRHECVHLLAYYVSEGVLVNMGGSVF